jgi:hypothetical protein
MALPASLLRFCDTIRVALVELDRTPIVGEVLWQHQPAAPESQARMLRASWLKESRAFRIVPARPQAKAG